MAWIKMDAGAEKVIDRLLCAGYSAYAVGGCVRDALLQKNPEDWDICSSALPEQTIELFGEENCIPTGLKHGTVTVKMDGGFYEVTTFRTDGQYSDGRHPDSVDFVTDVCEDLARRDFTINAMAYNEKEGLIDPFGGREDLLERRVVRAVGDPWARFGEDALRVMRLFRFAARYALFIEDKTLEGALALCENLRFVSGERTREEMLKLLSAKKPARYLRREIVNVIMPEMKAADDASYARMLASVDELKPDAQIRLAAMLSILCTTAQQGNAQAILKRLRCSNRQTERILNAIRGALDSYAEDDAPMQIRARYALGRMGMQTIEDILALAMAIRCEKEAQQAARFAAFARQAQETGHCCRIRDLAINGQDIMCRIGSGAGPKVGALLEALLDGVIKERLPNERTALLDAAARMARK